LRSPKLEEKNPEIQNLSKEWSLGAKPPAGGGKEVALSDFQDFSIKFKHFRPKFSLYNNTMTRTSKR